jgi:nucleotide-binding universal stress UspA family protein
MPFIMNNIILCIDGEKHTEKAIKYAMEITRGCKGTLTVLHVINPYLKKFADEIYAVGRIEYREYIDKKIRKESENIMAEFKSLADSEGVNFKTITRYGSPDEEIKKEIDEKSYDLLIIGFKPSKTLKSKLRSFNLPGKIFSSLKIPSLFVR